MSIIVEEEVYKRYKDQLDPYVVKKMLGLVVLKQDAKNVLDKLGVKYVVDRKAFKPISFPSPMLTVANVFTLDAIFHLLGLSEYVEKFNYPDFSTLDRPLCLIDSGVSDHEVFRTQQVNITKLYISKFDNGNDDIGHGTAVASILATIAPYSNIVSIKIFGRGAEEASYIDFVEALDIARQNNCVVINCSLGGYLPQNEQEVIDRALRTLYLEYDAQAISAVGNEGYMYASYPARSDYSIAVGSVGFSPYLRTFMKSRFSNFDIEKKKPEFVAVGENVNTAYLNNTYAVVSGTSFSTPQVSGLAYWIYYFYYWSRVHRIPLGYKIAVDSTKPFTSEVMRVLKELAKNNNPLRGLTAWNVLYGYGYPSYTVITIRTVVSSQRYRRPKPAYVKPGFPVLQTYVYIDASDGSGVELPSRYTQDAYNNVYRDYVRSGLFNIVQIVQTTKPTLRSRSFRFGGVSYTTDGGGISVDASRWLSAFMKFTIATLAPSGASVDLVVTGGNTEACREVEICRFENIVQGQSYECSLMENYFRYICYSYNIKSSPSFPVTVYIDVNEYVMGYQ